MVFHADQGINLIQVLQPECNVAIDFFIENKMFVDHDLFQAISLDK